MTSVSPLPTGTVLSCGHVLTDAMRDGTGTGYATDRTTGESLCYLCADDRQRASFLVAGMTGEPFGAYVSSSGDLTTWTGGVLARGVSRAHGVSRSGFHGSEVHDWRFRIGDAEWYGRNGGPGMAITVRRAKHAAR